MSALYLTLHYFQLWIHEYIFCYQESSRVQFDQLVSCIQSTLKSVLIGRYWVCINPMSDGGVGRGWLYQLFRKRAPAVSILIFVTQKLNDNFMQKILSCTSSWCNHPSPPITWAPFLIPSLIGLRSCTWNACLWILNLEILKFKI